MKKLRLNPSTLEVGQQFQNIEVSRPDLATIVSIDFTKGVLKYVYKTEPNKMDILRFCKRFKRRKAVF